MKENSVLAFDVDKFQFVADIRITLRDPFSVYVLSSKFHRFFLKNLEPNEINTRLIRIDDGGLPSKVSTLRANVNIVNQQYKTIENPFSSFYAARPRPVAKAHQRPKVPKYRFVRNENYYNVKSVDGLRTTKNVSYNISTFH